MNRLPIIAALFALVFLAGQDTLAQSGYDLFQKGLVQERVKGDLDEAIRLYKQIVEDFTDDRALVAKALVQMGGCYEKLGRAEARKAYERVVREFADQPETVQIARRHLEQLEAGAMGTAGNGPTYRLLVDAETIGADFFGFISPSGKRTTFVKDHKLYESDLTGTAIRLLVEDWGPWESPQSVVWSPDERLIAYRMRRDVKTESGTKREHAIFVLNSDGGRPRQVGPEIRGGIYGPEWTPDGRYLAYRTLRTGGGLHTITLDGDEVRFISNKVMAMSVKEHWVKAIGRYSPNGRWYVYTCWKEDPGPKKSDTDLCVIPSSGGTPRRLTHLPGSNGFPSWAPDGRTLYFVSGPVGRHNIWKLAMDPATGLAQGEPQQMTFFEDVRVMSPTPHGDGSRISFFMNRESSCIQVADVSAPHAARTLVRSGKHSPRLSPDGQTVYYVNDQPGEEGIYAVSRHGGASRRLTRSFPEKGRTAFDLSPDGRTLAYCVTLDKERELFELLTVPVSGGEPKHLVKIDSSCSVLPQWSPDGSRLAYAAAKSLYVIDADGGKPRKLATLERDLEEYSIRWSPDGKYIAGFGISEPNTMNAVLVVPASGGELRQLTPNVVYKEESGLQWHPDGTRLTYMIYTNRGRTRQAYLDGRAPSLLFDAPDIRDWIGTWHPDGHRYFFLGSGSVQGKRGWNLYAYDQASGKISPVVADLVDAGIPCWSQDGKTMAWRATKSTPIQLWLMENFLPKSTANE